jgi:hypothetical protein
LRVNRKIGASPAGLIVCGYVNAKNGFGGYTGEKMFFNFYGTKLVEIEPTPPTNKFTASWNRQQLASAKGMENVSKGIRNGLD